MTSEGLHQDLYLHEAASSRMSGGGFVVDDNAFASSSRSDQNGSTHTPLGGVEPLLSLTPRQENRLRAHVDDKLLGLERDGRKGSFGSLPQLVGRICPLLQLILQIPAPEPFGSLRVSYLLTLTGTIPSYITSQPLLSPQDTLRSIPPQLLPPGEGRERDGGLTPLSVKLEDDPRSPGTVSDISTDLAPLKQEAIASRTLLALLALLRLLDEGWQAVLRGEGWVMDLSGRGTSVPVRFGGQVGVTERIRLRSMLLAGREKIIAWARSYGEFPSSALPSDGQETPNGQERRGAEGQAGGGQDWESEVLGLFNGTLEALSDMTFAEADSQPQ